MEDDHQRFSAPESRIAHIAWLYPAPANRTAVVLATPEEIRLACELGERLRREHYDNVCWYGDPAYGRWPEGVSPLRELVQKKAFTVESLKEMLHIHA